MPFIPHTENDINQMLAAIGVNSIDALFAEIPTDLRMQAFSRIPEGLSEMALGQLLQERAAQTAIGLNFIGAGAYEHYIPAAVWDIASRGEFMTAYTPYQAEASQGTLQLIYEYQTMMANLTGMEVSNASLYDGASALAEAILMAVRANRRSKSQCVLIPTTIHPHYRQTVRTIVRHLNIELVEIPYCQEQGCIALSTLDAFSNKDITALVIPQPNFFGVLEEVDVLTQWAKQRNIITIAAVNPTTLALLKEPGQWGERGVDIVCGEGQPLGVPLASGGPYFGFLCCKQEYVRQMPGRIVGRTVDKEGKTGFALTLQAREQHIRRAKATSNICTNQGLLVTAATIYLSLLGAKGLKQVAIQAHNNTKQLIEKLTTIPGVEQVFNRPFFHEVVIRLPKPVEAVLNALAQVGIYGGYNLKPFYPELGESLLICATETKTVADIEQYLQALNKILN
jgi:glycine dehydrogenase subunit 1